MSVIDRKLGFNHFAFYRGWLEGLDIRVLADRYLETGLDLRLAKSTLQWVRDSLRQAALRHVKHGEARLLRLRLTSASATESNLPSLEDFRAEHDPSGFYSEEELIAEYLAAYPAAQNRKASQRQRLLQRQLDALLWLEKLVATEPVPADLVSAWFDKSVAHRLIGGGIHTIGDLMARIASKGYRWWSGVPKLGVSGAQRIVRWLGGYESSLGALPASATTPSRSLPATALVAGRKQRTGIVPIECLRVPAELDGTAADNRMPTVPQIDASNDREAINAWLDVKATSKNTERVYRKEAERLLLWAILERGKALSSLNVQDCSDYRDWLYSLGRVDDGEWPYRIPQKDWIAKRQIPRFSPDWRPFDGPLSPISIKHALTVIGALFMWLVGVQYCRYNPWMQVGKKVAPESSENVHLELTRVFSRAQWDYLIAHLNAKPINAHTQRLRFLLPFALATGMRGAELADVKLGRFYTMPAPAGIGVRWMLKVLGKGGAWRAVPVTGATMALIGEYLAGRGLHPDPLENPPETPLLARLDGKEGISYNSIYRLTKWLFDDVARSLRDAGRAHEAKAFARASSHWIRHTRGNMLALDDVPTSIIQKLFGHKSIETTSIYTESSEEQAWQILTALEKG
jgi:site-specific recombinase XerD